MIPDDPNALLTRDATAVALTESGYPTSPKTLATKASRGGAHASATLVPAFFIAGPTRSTGRKSA
jgi:hypothetical protein